MHVLKKSVNDLKTDDNKYKSLMKKFLKYVTYKVLKSVNKRKVTCKIDNYIEINILAFLIKKEWNTLYLIQF